MSSGSFFTEHLHFRQSQELPIRNYLPHLHNNASKKNKGRQSDSTRVQR